MRIAWLTPFSQASAIGKYSALVVAELSRAHQVSIFAPDLEDSSTSWPTSVPVERIGGKGGHPDLVRTLAGFDIVVYNLGNCLRFHLDIFRTSQVYPGVVILHDLSLHEFFEGLYLGIQEDGEGWIKQMAFAHGQPGAVLARQIIAGERPTIGSEPAALTYHMARTVVHGCLGVVVHGHWVRQQLAAVASMPVMQIDFPAPNLPAPTRAPQYLPTDAKVRLLTFGVVNPNKMSDRVIEAITTSPLLRRQVIYTIAGPCLQEDYQTRLTDLIRLHGLEGTVLLLGAQSESGLHQLIDEADVVVNLRNPHFGECSWSLLEALFLGKPTVVWKHGYYDEFPSTVVKKVGSLAQMRSALEELCGDPDQRQRLSQNARRYAVERFNTQAFCERFVAFAQECRANRPLYELVDQVSRHLQEIVGDTPAEDLVNLLGDEVSRFAGALGTTSANNESPWTTRS